MQKPDTTNMTKEEAAAALNAYYANIPLPAHLTNKRAKKTNKRSKMYDNYLLPEHRNV